MAVLCELCGWPLPEGEEMFRYHGYSGPCPKVPPESLKETGVTNMSSNTKPLCKDCLYIDDKTGNPTPYAMCHHHSLTNLVTGNISPRACGTMRIDGGACGPDGTLFVKQSDTYIGEPKDREVKR